ncbi:MAG: response regulator transcription factor, partial [Planktomarina sp.]
MSTPARILIVDDHAEIRTAIASYLTREGFRVAAAANGAEMDNHLVDHTVDLLVLDVMMPDEDGRSICARLRRSSDMPILMVSALDADDQKIEGLNIGADDYLAKPFNPK